MPDPDLLALMRQVRAEAELLRKVAREADMEMAAFVAVSRRKRQRGELPVDWHRLREGAGELGEVGVQPDTLDGPAVRRRN